MLKRNAGYDERVSQIKRKITNEAFAIMFLALTAIVFIKSVVLDIPTKEFITEFVLWTGIAFYVVVRMVMEGIYGQNIRNAKKRSRVMTAVLSDVVFTLALGAVQYSEGTLNAWFLLGAFAAYLVLFFVVLKITERISENRINKE